MVTGSPDRRDVVVVLVFVVVVAVPSCRHRAWGQSLVMDKLRSAGTRRRVQVPVVWMGRGLV